MKKFFSVLIFATLFFNNAIAENIISLSNSSWKIDDGRKNEYTFFSNGSCQYTYRDIWKTTKKNCRWSQEGKKVKININNGFFVQEGLISGKSISGRWISKSHGSGSFSGYVTYYDKVIASKPKNNQPKDNSPKKILPGIDDNKVVAAASGTGFFVSYNGHIVTNHHVIEDCNIVKVTFRGTEYKSNILAVDRKNDLAILKTNLKPKKVYTVSNEDAGLLEDVIIAGYPLGKKVSSAIKTSKGSITALAGYGDNYSEFQTDAALNQGNSGGPIINQRGNVIGVAVANYGKKSGVESFNFGIKSSTLKTFANSNNLKFLPPNNRDLSNKDLGILITEGTVYLECHMTVAKIKKILAQANSRKAFFSKFQ